MPDPTLAFLAVDPFGESSEPGSGAAFLVLLAFMISFLFIRTSARMIRAQVSWWPGNVETSSGLHLHHLVWGISLMLLSGFVAFALETPADPWYQLAALGFGFGAGLTFDEFALWVNLEDVYWAQQGRVSLDAVVLVTVFMGLVVIGTEPFGLEGGEAPALAALTVAQAFVLSIISFMKGRIGLGTLAIFIPFLGLWGALRLGKPTSPVGPAALHRQEARSRRGPLPARLARPPHARRLPQRDRRSAEPAESEQPDGSPARRRARGRDSRAPGRSRRIVIELRGKTVLVTGASQGLGAAIARAMAQRGAEVLLLARGEEKLREVAAGIEAPAAVPASTRSTSPTSTPSSRRRTRSRPRGRSRT